MTATTPTALPTTSPVERPPRVAWSHRLAERGVDRTLLLLVPGLVFLIAFFVYPFCYGLGLSLQPMAKYGTSALANYKQFLTDPYQRSTVWITLKISLPAALINVLASVPLAYRLRGKVRGKRLLTTALVIPITLGTVLTAAGMIEYFSGTGWLNRILIAIGLTDVDHPVPLLHNYWGVMLSLIVSGFPFAFLLTLSYLSGIDPNLERAAATLGAGWWQRFHTISFPLLLPGLAVTFCLNFVLAFSVFPSAVLLGDAEGTTHVISVAAYDAAYQEYDYSKASAIAMIMAAVMLVVISLVLFGRSRLYRGSSGGKG